MDSNDFIDYYKPNGYVKILQHYVFVDKKLKNPKSLFLVQCKNCDTNIGISRTSLTKYIDNKTFLFCPECSRQKGVSIPKFTNIPFKLPDGYITSYEYKKQMEKEDHRNISDEELLDRANITFKHLNLKLVSLTREPRSYEALCPTCKKLKTFPDGTLRTMPDLVQCKECRYPNSVVTTITDRNFKIGRPTFNEDDFFKITEVEESPKFTGSYIYPQSFESRSDLSDPFNSINLALMLEKLIGEESFKTLLTDKISTILAEQYSAEILKNDFK